MKHTPNRLINASSPYLLQHAYNPVDWHPWGEEALALAKAQDKPIIVSIGYSACHWCHVMERESFEQDDVAAVMNANYVCIKVDREERPDVDQVYMEAVQLMGANGGWPLNVILTPDAKPFYGGTYFPKPQWTQLLAQVADAFANHRDELEKSAQELTAHLQRSEMERYRLTGGTAPSLAMVERALEKQYSKYDGKQGGMNRAPKFPMPSLYAFLMRYGWFMPDGPNHAHALLTLRKMALGGIYDQVGGGFARYSVDKDWLVPHFEKMLYDNALLLSLYAEAYSATGDALFKETVMETAIFMEGMLQSEEGGFFSALDADSEGEEGKFYIWTAQELRDLLGEDAPLFFAYYQIQENGNWEHGNNILHRATTDEAFAQRYHVDVQALKQRVRGWKRTLWAKRALRVLPGLDDKVLASWNGLALAGFADAYKAIGEPLLLELAFECAEFLEEKMANGQALWHTYKNGTASLQGYLEDYAAVAQGYIALYQACFDEKWLHRAHELCEYALAHFYDPADGLFFFSDNTGEQLIARKKEIFDSVIPSSNALMAHNLYDLWVLLGIESYRDKAQAMVGRMSAALEKEMVYLSHWGSLILKMLAPTAEIAVVGQEGGQAALKAYRAVYMPNVYLSASEVPSQLPLLQHRPAPEQGCAYYICQHGACQLPVFNHAEAEAVLSRMASGQ